MVSPYISRRILLHTPPLSPWILFSSHSFGTDFSNSVLLFSEKILSGKSKYYSFCLNWGTLCESFFALMCLSYVGTIEKKVRLDFLYWSKMYQRRMERDEKKIWETQNKLSEWARSLVVCLNYKIIRERHKKLISVGEVMIIMMNHKNRHPLECYALCVTLLYPALYRIKSQSQ